MAGLAVALVGVAVLAGWLLDIGRLRSILPNLSTMKANTALSFTLGGSALWWLAAPAPGRRARRLAQACAVTIVLVAGLTLGEYLAGRDFGIDQLLFADPSAVG